VGKVSWGGDGNRSGASGLAALRAVGLVPRPPVWSTSVLTMPAVLDTIGMTAPVTGGGSRVRVLVGARQQLLDSLSSRVDPDRTVGLLGVTFHQRPLPITGSQFVVGTVVELTVTATPVWSDGARVPSRPFRTAFDSCQVATLLAGGWVPVDLLIAGTTETRLSRHKASDAAVVTRRINKEVPGATDMVQRGRRHLRDRLYANANALGADGLLIHGGFSTAWSSTHHLVQIDVIATAISRWGFHGPTARTTLNMR
jgi:hypothetical protein